MYLGINWHKDTRIGSFKELFTDNTLRKRFGVHLKETLAGGFLRYPGGEFVQHLPLSLEDAAVDVLNPGYPVFYAFCHEFGLKVLQQLPTFGYSIFGCRKTIKKSSKGSIDWGIVDEMVSKAASFMKWVYDNDYDENIIFWQIGNEDWHVIEGAMKPVEYVEIFERYIKAIGRRISPEKILVVAQPGKRGNSHDWGMEVLRLLKFKGYAGTFGGVTIHVYPYFLSRSEFDREDFDFNTYCTGESLPQIFKAEFTRLSDTLDNLGFNEKIKVHVTETAIDIAGPQAVDEWYTFKNNRKTYAAAYGVSQAILSIAKEKRFGSASYHSLTHKYLIAPEHRNPTIWEGYTKADDWGWGQCWFIPENLETTFLNTPLLEAWSALALFLNGASTVGELRIDPLINAFMALGTAGTKLFLFNKSYKSTQINITGNSQGFILGDGDLNKRVLKQGSHGIPEDIAPLKLRSISLSGEINVPPFAIFFAEGNDLAVNGVGLSPELLRTKAFFKGRELALGSFFISYINGNLIPFPKGVRIENYPLALIRGLNGRDMESISREIFFVSHEDICEWSIGDEEKYT